MLSPSGRGDFDEDWLQRLIHANPDCLPIEEIEPGLDRFKAICREMPTRHGNIDNLLMTGRGDIAIVETKLFRNSEARRAVVAQALDYATCLFEMDYETFDNHVLRGTYSDLSKPSSLYAALQETKKLDRAAFQDAVSRNLRAGRALILIVGDGIRSETKKLFAGLDVHARFGFTLAIVELSVFRMPESDTRLLVRPRTLAKTEIVQRTIIEVVNRSDAIVTVKVKQPPEPERLGTEAYWIALQGNVPGAREPLQQLIEAAKPLDVYAEFQRGLNLKWDRPGNGTVNLGIIGRDGSISTEVVTRPDKQARIYVDELAACWDCYVKPRNEGWSVYKNGQQLYVSSVLDRLDRWLTPMQRFIDAVMELDAQASTG